LPSLLRSIAARGRSLAAPAIPPCDSDELSLSRFFTRLARKLAPRASRNVYYIFPQFWGVASVARQFGSARVFAQALCIFHVEKSSTTTPTPACRCNSSAIARRKRTGPHDAGLIFQEYGIEQGKPISRSASSREGNRAPRDRCERSVREIRQRLPTRRDRCRRGPRTG